MKFRFLLSVALILIFFSCNSTSKSIYHGIYINENYDICELTKINNHYKIVNFDNVYNLKFRTDSNYLIGEVEKNKNVKWDIYFGNENYKIYFFDNSKDIKERQYNLVLSKSNNKNYNDEKNKILNEYKKYYNLFQKNGYYIGQDLNLYKIIINFDNKKIIKTILNMSRMITNKEYKIEIDKDSNYFINTELGYKKFLNDPLSISNNNLKFFSKNAIDLDFNNNDLFFHIFIFDKIKIKKQKNINNNLINKISNSKIVVNQFGIFLVPLEANNFKSFEILNEYFETLGFDKDIADGIEDIKNYLTFSDLYIYPNTLKYIYKETERILKANGNPFTDHDVKTDFDIDFYFKRIK